MKLFELFIHRAPNRIFLSILFGALSGVCYSLLIPLVQVGIGGAEGAASGADTHVFLGVEVHQHKLAMVFFALCACVLFLRSFSQITLLRVAMEVTTELRRTLYERISQAPIADLERMGSARLIAAITTDVGRIVFGARVLPDLLISAVTIIGMLGFMSYLDFPVFMLVLQAIAFGAITYQIPMFLANRYFQRSRERIDPLQDAIQGLINGAKELKLDRVKQQRYFADVLMDNEYAVMRADKTGNTIVRLAANYGDMISFLVIGVIAYVFVNYHALTAATLTGVIMAMLYITTPIALVINTVPAVFMARISLKKVNTLLASIPSETYPEAAAAAPDDWAMLTLRGLEYSHAGNGDDPGFHVGPIDLDIRRGEVTFIVGGNGSGKSTLSKLISLHYRASNGQMLFGDQTLDDATIGAYRNQVCSIYSDYHLFDRLLSDPRLDEDEKIREYMSLLKLEGKLSIVGRRFSTRALSDGQRKRLALLAALIEDKPLYLFDEWAADQDPSFKEIFYRRIIHDLKARGKAVIVISHDDRFFGEADRIVYMESGRLREVIDAASTRDGLLAPAGSDLHAPDVQALHGKRLPTATTSDDR
ncbi:cyclic peptide export ABC transporter [Xanthomonas arboricola]|uniref:cyclic peptide export ABC transporter n=1 Tax=Xanthomonas arboricola TaxID=56448 RepID=UPI0003A6ECE2|nr:cyclic peptide export ABC transporter [Xanthomonas arboricola]MDN0207943.1 cyclic peptide export ABC transporter [Xanthomonas arboricola pv. corylina]MDN0212413.1 cyclic peptide export ABC transporter [Xanthomonas arboricola pv. corylina]